MKKLLISIAIILICSNAFGAEKIRRIVGFNSDTQGSGRIFVSDGNNFNSVVMGGDCSVSSSGNMDCSTASGASELTELSDVNGATTTNGNLLVADGSNFNSVVMSGDCTVTNSGVMSCSVGSGDITAVGNITSGEAFTSGTPGDDLYFVGSSSPSHATGLLTYSTDDESLEFHNNESDIKLQIGQEFYIRVRNSSGSTISNGKAVYVSGNHVGSGLPTIELAQSDSLSTSQDFIGLATHDIENNTIGYVTSIGRVGGLDTSGFSNGDMLWVDDSTAGELTATRPSQPNFTVPVGVVTKANASNGTIHVFPGSIKFGAYTDTRVAFGGSDGFIKEDSGFVYNSTTDILSLGGGVDAVGAVDLDYGSADVTDHTFVTDGTGDAEFVVPNDSIGNNELDWGSMTDLTTDGAVVWGNIAEGELANDTVLEADLKAVDTASDEECLTYETTTGDFEWQSCGSGATELTGLSDVNSSTSSVGRFLIADGNNFNSVAMTGSCTLDGDGVISCPSGGSAITLDIGDDSGNDSTDLNEIATTGDTNSVITEPSADKMLIDFGQNWPTADDVAYINGKTTTNGNMLVADGSNFNSVVIGGDATITNSGTLSLKIDVIDTSHMADDDHGDFTYSTGTATLDANVVASAEMGDDDHGDFTYSSNSATLDSGVVDTNEIAFINSATATLGNLLIADGNNFNSVVPGRSLTGESGQLIADAETYTVQPCLYIEDPVAADDLKDIWSANQGGTITAIQCRSDQIVNLDLQIEETDVVGYDLNCTTNTATQLIFAGDTTLSATDFMDLAVNSTTNTPTYVNVCWECQFDD